MASVVAFLRFFFGWQVVKLHQILTHTLLLLLALASYLLVLFAFAFPFPFTEFLLDIYWMCCAASRRVYSKSRITFEIPSFGIRIASSFLTSTRRQKNWKKKTELRICDLVCVCRNPLEPYILINFLLYLPFHIWTTSIYFIVIYRWIYLHWISYIFYFFLHFSSVTSANINPLLLVFRCWVSCIIKT